MSGAPGTEPGTDTGIRGQADASGGQIGGKRNDLTPHPCHDGTFLAGTRGHMQRHPVLHAQPQVMLARRARCDDGDEQAIEVSIRLSASRVVAMSVLDRSGSVDGWV